MGKFYVLGDGRIITETEAKALVKGRVEFRTATKEDVEVAMKREWMDLAGTITKLLGENDRLTVEALYEMAANHLVALHRYKKMFHGWHK